MDNISLHCLIGMLIRLVLIVYGEIQDNVHIVQYTDIDYRVFTDAARHMLEGRSPYDRHTYRYTPLLAAALIPNICLFPFWGKFLFSVGDLIVGCLIRLSVLHQGFRHHHATYFSLAWLYNPLAIVIATRGNADSICAALVLVTLLLIQKRGSAVLAGITHALAIHIRLYPVAFSLAMYLALGMAKCNSGNAKQKKQELENKYFSLHYVSIKKIFLYLYPNRDQILLVLSCVLTLTAVTCLCYWFYGNHFLNESILYHLKRRDIRHNFSVYFYKVYLSSAFPSMLWQRILVFLPQTILLVALSVIFGSRQCLSFAMLCQTVVMVTYNPVVTSQYFVWFLSLLPTCLPAIRLSLWQGAALASLWLAAQISWLLPAYLLEFRGQDTFFLIWIQGLAFFCANIAILGQLIINYEPALLKTKKIR